MSEAKLLAAIVLPLWWGANHGVGLVFGPATVVAILIGLYVSYALTPLLWN